MAFNLGNLTIKQKGWLLVCVPLAFELAFVSIFTYLLAEADAQLKRELRSRTIIARSNLLMRHTLDAAMNAGAFGFTRNRVFIELYDKALGMIDGDFAELKKLLASNPEQAKNLEEMKKTSEKLIGRFNRLRKTVEEDPDNLMMLMSNSSRYVEMQVILSNLARQTEDIMVSERAIEKEGSERQARTRLLIQIALWICVLVNIILAFYLARFFTGQVAERVRVLADNSLRLGRKQELNPPLAGNDELAGLDAVFRDMVQNLKALDQQKAELMATVGHELRTPLSSVRSTLSLLNAGVLGELPDKARKKVALTETDVNRLISIINDLLDAEKIDAGKLEMLSRDVALSTVIERSLIAVSGVAEAASVKIEVEPTEMKAFADEDRLVQVVVNFLSNAIKFSPADAVIRIECVDMDRFVRVEVRDNGPGIAPEFLGRVFERFEQSSREDATTRGGSGLGLYVCRKIIEQLAGEIGVESEIGSGSTFWFKVAKGG